MTHEQIIAMPAGPELDALVAERILGWRGEDEEGFSPCESWVWRDAEGYKIHGPTQFSTDMAAAWLALAKCPHEWEIGCDPAGWGDVKIYGWRGTPDDGDDVEHKAGFEHISKAPAAICKALLLDALTR